MKRYNHIGTLTAVLAAVLILLAGCSKEGIKIQDRPLPPAGMGELTLGQLQLLGGETATAQARAGASSNLPEGSTLRLYAFAEGETDFGSQLATRTYTISATGAAQLDAGQEPLFLPKGKADIYLVGPVEHNTGTQAAPVMVEVASEWGIYPRIGADLIATYAQATIVAGNTNPLPPMTLEHKMARAQIVVETNPAAVYENLVVEEVKLYGQPTTGTFTLDNTGGVITAGQQLEDFVCPSVAKDPIEVKYSATTVLLPQAEREFKVETTFECNQKNTEQGDNHPTLRYRQSGLITAPLAAGTATRFSTAPITPVEIKWRTKVLPWNEVQQDDITAGSELEYNIAIPPRADQYIEISGLKWAKGNLVAKNNNQCMVGEPTDGGLYFHYGSLIGWWGGADGSGVGTPNIKNNPTFQVKPFKFSGTPAYGLNYYTGSTAGVLTDLVADSHTTAIGDPCRYYLGSQWRLPTGEEMGFLCNNSLTVEGKYDWGATTNSVDHTNKNPSGAWFNTTTPSSGEGLFFPAAGVYHETGYSSGKNQYGYYWSSSIHVAKPTESRSLHFTLNGVYPQWHYLRTYALPVRCVSGTYTPPPPADSYIPTAVLEAAGWPADKLPKTGLQVAMRGDKQMPGSGTPGTDAARQWKTDQTAIVGVESVNTFAAAQFGVGKANTDAMIRAGASLHPVAQYCRDMGPEWYLPSIKELKLIFDKKNLLGSSYSFSTNVYWSSTNNSSSSYSAWWVSFLGGTTASSTGTNNVRCVREI